jgi:uncharacterized membrane protein YphA (DoxX/SURF4 family)
MVTYRLVGYTTFVGEQKMNLYLWIGQTLLGLIFLGSGIAKSTMSRERMAATGQSGVAGQPLGFIRFIAGCEILGSLAMVLPIAFGIAPFLTPIAAIGLAIIMLGAARIHTKLREPKAVAVNILLLALCIFIAYGRR